MRILTMTALTMSLAFGAAGASFAQENPGVAQLEAEAGVPAGVMSTSDLYRLIRAQRENDQTTVSFLLNRAGLLPADQAGVEVYVMPEDGNAQLAAQVGVEPGVYTTNELTRLLKAQQDNDLAAIDFIMAGGDRDMMEARSEVTAGEEQLAAELGVNPAYYTLAELTEMKARVDTKRADG